MDRPDAAPTRPPVLDCTPLLSGVPLDDEAATHLAAALRVLADPARLRILSLIRAQPDQEACVCHLTDALGLSQPTVSHHLKVLYGAGLLERDRRGTWVYYRTVRGALAGLRAALGEIPVPSPPPWPVARRAARAPELTPQDHVADAPGGCRR